MNKLAGDINSHIDQGGDKLDELNKEMGQQVEDLKNGNYALAETVEITKARNSNMLCWVGIILALAAVVGVTVYFTFFKEDKNQQNNQNNNKQ